VFADLGFPNPEEEQLKARLAYQIMCAIKRLGLSQAKAAKLLKRLASPQGDWSRHLK